MNHDRGSQRRRERVLPVPIEDSRLWPKGRDQPPAWKVLKKHLQAEGKVRRTQVLQIINDARRLFSEEPNLLDLTDPITVVGDIHGQYYDMMRLLECGGDPSKNQYLFLGDYVDRGSFSCAVVLFLFALKINFPKSIYLLRGNHECRQLTSYFNFKEECRVKYDLVIYEKFMQAFDCLPLAALVNKKFFAVHGGLGPDLHDFRTSIASIYRFEESPREGLHCDLVWSDPHDEERNKAVAQKPFTKNDVRGCSWFFTIDAAADFLQRNQLLSVVRAHEAQMNGFKMYYCKNQAKEEEFPKVITIFSAPNYCDCYANKAAIISFQENALNIQQFNHVSHPYCLADFMNCFSWSIPFVVEKVNSLLSELSNSNEPATGKNMRSKPMPAKIAALFSDQDGTQVNNRRQSESGMGYPRLHPDVPTEEETDLIRQKVLACAVVLRSVKTLRDNEGLIQQLKDLNYSRIPPGSLLNGEQGLISEIERLKVERNLNQAA